MKIEIPWISVKDRLPEIGEPVLVYTPKATGHRIKALTRLTQYEGSRDFFWDNIYGGSNTHIAESVTHWVSLRDIQLPESQ